MSYVDCLLYPLRKERILQKQGAFLIEKVQMAERKGRIPDTKRLYTNGLEKYPADWISRLQLARFSQKDVLTLGVNMMLRDGFEFSANEPRYVFSAKLEQPFGLGKFFNSEYNSVSVVNVYRKPNNHNGLGNPPRLRVKLEVAVSPKNPKLIASSRKQGFTLTIKLVRRITLGLDFNTDFRCRCGNLLVANSPKIASPRNINFEESDRCQNR